MKNAALFIVLSGLAFLLQACEESFSPKIPFVERPVLQCIFVTTTFSEESDIHLTLARTYDVEGYNPRGSTADPALHGAEVLATVGERHYVFSERRAPVSQATGSVTGLSYYTAKDVFLYPGATVTITAYPRHDMPRLTATTVVPTIKPVESTPYWPPRGVNGNVDRIKYGAAWVLDWQVRNFEEHLFFPNLTLYYSRWTGTLWVPQQVEIPMRLLPGPHGPVPEYPGYTTELTCSFDYDALNYALRQISAGDTNKQNYVIGPLSFTLIEFDFALSKFYASTHGSLDQFSVRPNESVFSNVQGGIGILGSALRDIRKFAVDPDYIESFGYRTNPPGPMSMVPMWSEIGASLARPYGPQRHDYD